MNLTKPLVDSYIREQYQNYGRVLTNEQAREELLGGSFFRVFRAGTTILVNTYEDKEFKNAHPNPVEADRFGYFKSMFLEPGEYCIKISNWNDAPIASFDNFYSEKVQ